MNLVKAAELLKNAPEDTLKKYLANPNGEFPEYLVVSEITRRDDMRKRYAAELQGQPPKTSIIEELLQRDNAALRQPAEPPMQEQAPSTAMGLGSVPPPPDMQLSAPPMVAAAQQPEAPQQFYDGGVVALAGGGGISDVADAFNEYMRPSAHSGERGYRVGVSPSLPVGRGSVDVNAAAVGSEESFDGPMPMPTYKGYQGRVGASYPIGEGRLSAGISGVANKYGQNISGYDVGYNDERNRLMANISPTPQGNAYGINYGRQLDQDSSINAGLMRDPRGQMSGNLMYMRRFANGGEVEHFATGNPVVYKPDLSAFDVNTKLMQPQEITEVKDLPFYQKQMADLAGPSATEGYQESLAKQRNEIESRKRNYLSDFLIKSGLGMAAAKTPHPLQAAAQGLAGGFEDYQKSKEADAAAERALIDSEFKFKQAQRAENMGLLGLSRQALSDAMADRRSGMEAARSAEALRLQSAANKDAALRGAADIGLRSEEVILRGKEIAAANQRHKEEVALREREIKDRIDARQEITPAIRAQAANVVSDAIVRYRKTLDEMPPKWYEDAQARITAAPNDIARQTEMQRLERQIRINSGLSADILKIAGFN